MLRLNTAILIEQVASLTYVVQPLQTPCSSINQLDYRLLKTIDSNHRVLISRALPTGQTQNLLVAPAITELSIDEHSIWQTIRQFVLEGTHHLLIGADHLLFLFCILVPAVYQTRQTRKAQLIPVEQPMLALKQVIWVATAFTVAHSITLTLATLQWVQLPAQWVESVIAGSIVVAALMNLFGTHRRQVLLAFSFGLVHGFGFANVLSDLPLQ
ncbi:MAG: HupE/UreJ family protein, partial [Flavobacteriales bacterium]